MYIKSIFLSIICSAIAFTAKAQKSLPVFQSWNKDNYPVYVSHIEPLTKGANKLPQVSILCRQWCNSIQTHKKGYYNL